MNKFERVRVAQNRERRRLKLRPKKEPAGFESGREGEKIGSSDKHHSDPISKPLQGKMFFEIGAFQNGRVHRRLP
jgi:hypothetical protein